MSQSVNPLFRTSQRVAFNPLEPDQGIVDIEDIATGLANTCRYGGVLPDGIWYNNASHSVFVMQLLEYVYDKEELDKGMFEVILLAGLLHDAPEVYLQLDIPSPIKGIVKLNGLAIRRIEGDWMKVIFGALLPEISEAKYHVVLRNILSADRAVKEIEEQIIWNAEIQTDVGWAAWDSKIRPSFWCPRDSRSIFLQHYHRLQAELSGLGCVGDLG